jgi:acyl carrier protein
VDRQYFFNELAQIFQISSDEFHEGYLLTEDHWDSAALLSVIALIDESFGLTVPTNQLAQCRSAAAVLKLVEATRGAGLEHAE